MISRNTFVYQEVMFWYKTTFLDLIARIWYLFKITRKPSNQPYTFRHSPFDIQGGGGAWVFGQGQDIFFGQNRSKIFFFTGTSGRIIFFITESYIYNIQAFATTSCLIQAFATTSCFCDNLILKFKAFAFYSHSIQVFATTTDCSSRKKHTSSLSTNIF